MITFHLPNLSKCIDIFDTGKALSIEQITKGKIIENSETRSTFVSCALRRMCGI